MARVTLRLPEDLHRQLRAASRRTGVSLNELIVVAVRDALERGSVEEMADPVGEQVQSIREALGDLVVELDVASLPPQLRPNEDLPDSDALRETMPQLVPPLSATIVDDRQDRL